MITPDDMQIGNVFRTKNFGDLIIIKYEGYDRVTIEFLNTGTQRIIKSSNIRLGAVRDPYLPSVAGIGYTGEGKYEKTRHGKYKKIYNTWSGMIKRCYSINEQKNAVTYKDCSVCKEWHNFQTFAKWFEDNYKSGLHIDKDILIDGNKEYSPTTCKFVTQEENNQKAKALYFTLIAPDGQAHNVYNLEEFCRLHKLDSSSLRHVRAGKREHEKGWKLITYGTR